MTPDNRLYVAFWSFFTIFFAIYKKSSIFATKMYNKMRCYGKPVFPCAVYV